MNLGAIKFPDGGDGVKWVRKNGESGSYLAVLAKLVFFSLTISF